MRPFTLDGRAVVCRNARSLGSMTCTARVGCFFVSDEGTARMIGRVAYAPAIGDDIPAVRNWILALVMPAHGQFIMERWIDPATVRECYAVPPSDLAAFFFAPKLPYDARTLLRLSEYGTLQQNFVAHHADTVAEFKRRDTMAAGGFADRRGASCQS